jgi:hypothetical protein
VTRYRLVIALGVALSVGAVVASRWPQEPAALVPAVPFDCRGRGIGICAYADAPGSLRMEMVPHPVADCIEMFCAYSRGPLGPCIDRCRAEARP